jgi:hypothetical protein
MEVSGDHAADALAVELVREDALPQRARVRQPEPGVDHGEAVAVVQEPEVDVIQRERQRHAEPADAGSDGERGAGRGRPGPRMLESGHCGIVLYRACSWWP